MLSPVRSARKKLSSRYQAHTRYNSSANRAPYATDLFCCVGSGNSQRKYQFILLWLLCSNFSRSGGFGWNIFILTFLHIAVVLRSGVRRPNLVSCIWCHENRMVANAESRFALSTWHYSRWTPLYVYQIPSRALFSHWYTPALKQ